MACRPQRLRCAASLGLGVLSAAGQTPPPSPTANPQLPPALAAKATTPVVPPIAPAQADNPRPVSPEIAAALAAAMPRYDPPAAPPALPGAESAASAAAPTPQNGIVRLPSFLVRDTKIPEFTERQLYTEQGLKDLAVKRYISEFDQVLNWFTIPLFSGYSTASDKGNAPEKRAMRKFEAAEDEKRAAEMRELMSLGDIH